MSIGNAAIADYLDIETGRIDALITKKRRMIHLLEARWVALVVKTTRGSPRERNHIVTPTSVHRSSISIRESDVGYVLQDRSQTMLEAVCPSEAPMFNTESLSYQ